MRAKTGIWIVRLCGIPLALAAGVGFIYRDNLGGQLNPPPVRITDLMLYGTEVVIVVAVRLLIFGLGLRKRLGVALLLSVLGAAVIGVLPVVVSVLVRGVSSVHGPLSDFWMGLFFFAIDFVVPCTVGSVLLAAVPIFDDRFSGRPKPAVCAPT